MCVLRSHESLSFPLLYIYINEACSTYLYEGEALKLAIIEFRLLRKTLMILHVLVTLVGFLETNFGERTKIS